jgi:serine/threonine-protein kinase RsbW
MAVVDVRFSALPAHVGTARLVAGAVARRSGVTDGVLDEVRTAVGEACARAVDLHQRFAPTEAVRMEISDERGRLGITVIDAAPDLAATEPDRDGIGSGRYDPSSIATAEDMTHHDPASDILPDGFGIAVIRALVDQVEITSEPAGGGTRIRMSWPVDGLG